MKTPLLMLFLVSLIAPASASAATLSIVAEPARVGVGDIVRVSVFVDSDTPVNAFSGELAYPAGTFRLEGVSDGGSIVNAWIERPHAADLVKVRPSQGAIAFAGGTAGGFAGRGGLLFSALLRVTRAGKASVSFSDVSVLRADGLGTPESVAARPLALNIARDAAGGFREPPDSEPPEPFDISLMDAGEGPMLVFAAMDKGSGIDRYEVAESRPPFGEKQFLTIDGSPYRMRDRYLTSDVYVKAIDRSGNERVAVFHRAHLLRPYEWIVLCGILIVLASLALRRFLLL